MVVATIDYEGQITIPQCVQDALHLTLGDQVVVAIEGEHAILYPLRRKGLAALRGAAQGRRPYPGREAERNAAHAQAACDALAISDE